MHRRPILPRLALAALLLTLAACASGEPKRNWARGERLADPGDVQRPRPARIRLFISPSGEPFRVEAGLAAWFSGADADHDGALTYAEFEADAMRVFKLLDTNHDGTIDGFEIQAYERERVPEIGSNDLLENQGPVGRPRGGERRGGGGRRGGGPGGGVGGREIGQTSAAPDIPTFTGEVRGAGREGAARYGLLNEPEPVANADSDVDGRVSLTEWKVATKRRFERLDRAKTGRLILADLILPPGAKPPAPPKPPLP